MQALLLLIVASVGQSALLGSKKCTYGPSYWCSHIEHAKACGALQHCVTTVWKNQLQGLTGATESCYDVLKILDDVRHSDVANLPEKMAGSCLKMSAEKHSVCKDLMINNQAEVLLLLQSDLPSINVAAALGLCGSFSGSASHHDVENEQAVQEVGDYCTDCLKFFGDLQEIFNKTEENVAEKLKEKICTKLGFFEKLCNETVDTYTEFVISIIVQQLNPQDLCYLIRFCTNESRAEFRNSLQYITARLQTVECDLCQNLAKDIQNALRDTTLQKGVLSAVENRVCPMLPADLVDQCKSVVSDYGYMIFQVLIAELDPAIICHRFGFCNATETEEKLTVVPVGERPTTVRLQSPEPREKALPQCALCEFIMKELGSMIDSNATEAEIISALDKVCSVMPKTLAADCTGFVDKYGKEIIGDLMKMTPGVVCTALGLCGVEQPVLEYRPVPVKDDDKCLVCESVVTYIRYYLNNPDNVKTIDDLLDEVCALVPSSYKALCEEMINTYAPSLINLLNQYDDPLKLCSELKLCKEMKTEGNMRGHPAKPLLFVAMSELQPAVPHVLCSQGPRVWCTSLENARQCKAVDYCVENYNLKMEG